MENNSNMIESLLQSATEYGKTSLEVAKLKTLDKTSDVASTIIPHAIVIFFLITFLLFINLGLALFLGEILNKAYYGFFIVGGFYLIVAIVIHFFMHKRLKMFYYNFIIKLLLN